MYVSFWQNLAFITCLRGRLPNLDLAYVRKALAESWLCYLFTRKSGNVDFAYVRQVIVDRQTDRRSCLLCRCIGQPFPFSSGACGSSSLLLFLKRNMLVENQLTDLIDQRTDRQTSEALSPKWLVYKHLGTFQCSCFVPIHHTISFGIVPKRLYTSIWALFSAHASSQSIIL